MPELTEQVRAEAVALIERLRSGTLDDEQLSTLVERLDCLLPDPNYWSYTIDAVPELTPDDIVRRAFTYRPITL